MAQVLALYPLLYGGPAGRAAPGGGGIRGKVFGLSTGDGSSIANGNEAWDGYTRGQYNSTGMSIKIPFVFMLKPFF